MECNREEAIRVKTIAEGKLVERDYAGAKKFALKAQSLYPGLEGLSQMFTTLDVYIAAENKISGEVDWYGILGVNSSADDETVRKQYRKLALLLHPDKNKSVGADGAFKLLSEAWSLLSDKAKRLAYNQRRSVKVFQQKVQTPSGRPPSAGPSANGFHNFMSRTTSKPMTQTNSAPPPSFRRTDTFWTICYQCNMHYEYLKVYLNHTLLCPNCQKAFLATERSPPPVNLSKSFNPSSRQHHQNSNNHGPRSNSNIRGVPFSRMSEPSVAAKASNVVQQANERLKRDLEDSQIASSSVLKGEGPLKKRRGLDDHGHVNGGRVPYQMAMGNVSGLRKGGFETDRVYGFSGSSSKPTSTRELTLLETRNMLMEKARMEIHKKLSEWRLKTEKEKVKESKEEKEKNTKGNAYNPNGNGKPFATKKEGRVSLPQRVTTLIKEKEKKQEGSHFTNTSAEDTDKKELEPLAMNVPDPDFHDFDLDRTESSFGDNQVWAAYDDDDGMPRFYAIIHKVISKKPFKMRISWLNSKTNSEFGPLSWVGSGFYKTCGEFWVGRHENNKSINSFSHKVNWAKGARGSVLLFPKKGDVWALYRNWSHDWNEHTPDEVIHKYDMVEVLDDYNEEQGITVAPLVKVAGFKTVFYPHMDTEKVKRIPKEEMFRFSHQVPNYLLTGQEAQNAPKGCLELDPAATPLDLLQVITESNDVPMMENGEKIDVEMLQSGSEIRTEEIVDGSTKAKEEEMVENGDKTKVANVKAALQNV